MRVDPNAERGYDGVLQDARRQSEYFEKLARGPRPQKWGDSTQLQNAFSAPAATIFPDYCFIDIGPFPTPRQVRLEEDCQPAAVGTAHPSLAYTIQASVGQAAYAFTTTQLPRTLTVQSLQLFARRVQQSVAPDPFKFTIWAAPASGPGGLPTPFLMNVASMGVGVGALGLVVPRLATHIMVGLGAGEATVLTQTISLQVAGPAQLSPATVQIVLASSVAGGPSQVQQAVPLPQNQTTYNLRRTDTTISTAYEVYWCR